MEGPSPNPSLLAVANAWPPSLGAVEMIARPERIMFPKPSHYATAEKIITTQGLAFALAVSVGKEGDLRTAREMLKGAIAHALAAEFERVHAATKAGTIA